MVASLAGGGEKGGAAVEFALVLPILLLILFSILEFGWFFFNQYVFNHAVSAGARAAVRAREWEGEDPGQIAREAFEVSCWTVNEEQMAKVDFSAVRMDQPVDSIAVSAVMPHRTLTGFLRSGEPGDQQESSSLIPGSLYAKAVMAFP